MIWLPICATFSASPRCCAMVAHTIANRAIHSIPLRCWCCGRSHRYGDRRLRYKCTAVRLACRCRHSIDGRALLNAYGWCCRRNEVNREILRQGLLLGTSAAAVTRNVGNDPIDVHSHYILTRIDLGDGLERELRVEHRSVVCTSRKTEPLCNVHVVGKWRGHGPRRQHRNDGGRLNFVTTHGYEFIRYCSLLSYSCHPRRER